MLIGRLNFLTNARPDICFAVQTLGQFTQAPQVPHYNAVEHLLICIKGTVAQGIPSHKISVSGCFYQSSSFSIALALIIQAGNAT